MRRTLVTAFAALAAGAGTSGSALAAGYDTPILYTARHMGLGGAAIGYVNDPSALFHNPAGLSHTENLSFIVHGTLLVGEITSAPDRNDVEVGSDTTVAPFPLLGASYRINDWLTAGLAAYPVASAGAEYTYDNAAGVATYDATTLIFVEISPGLSFDLPGDVKLGVGYRMTRVSLLREKGRVEDPKLFNLDLVGWSFGGVRAGLQWSPMDGLEFGATYRHKTDTEIEADSSFILNAERGKTTTTFTLPSKLGFGVRADLDALGVPAPVSVVFDAEYGFQSQNDRAVIRAETDGTPLEINNFFEWEDAWTLRPGVEFRPKPQLPLRVGYVWDGKVGNKQYPTAFGTPPNESHTVTLGAGYEFDSWQLNAAYAYRTGEATVTTDDLQGAQVCLSCSKAGDYQLTMQAIYLDASFDF